MAIVYLNGQYIKQEDAKISVMDRGFLFGDSIYEVIPCVDGHFVGGQEHYDRMVNSLKAILMPVPITFDELNTICHELLSKNQLEDTGIYIQITRGADTNRNHALPKDISPNIVAFCLPPMPRSKAMLEKGFKAITLEDNRKKNNFIKSTALIDNVLLYEKAKAEGAIEAILIKNDVITECTSSNLFIVKDNELYTPNLHVGILPGVTRQLTLRFAKALGLTCHEEEIHKDMLDTADEIWVTASRKEICPIVQLNDKMVGNGQAGPVWHKLYEKYEHYKKEPC